MGQEQVGLRILITGAGGLIGSSLSSMLTQNGHEVSALTHEEFDVTDYHKCAQTLKQVRPELVIHCAAMISVDRAEKDPTRAYLVNAYGTANIAVQCNHLDVPMMYFSSCSVFDGTGNVPYRTWDRVNPQSVYAITKVVAEQEIRSLLRKYYIVRSVYVYGRGRQDFVTLALNKLRNEEHPDFPVIEQVLNVVHVDDLCQAAVDLIAGGRYGTYHYSNSGQTTRRKLIEFLAQLVGKSDYTFSDYQGTGIRSPYTLLDTSVIEPLLSFEIPSWQESLAKFIQSQ